MSRAALVVGVGGAVGEAIALGLSQRGWNVRGTMRRDHADVAKRLTTAGVSLSLLDLDNPAPIADLAAGLDAIVFAPILSLAVAALPHLGPAPPRILAISSNNVAVDPDAPTYRALAAAEHAFRDFQAQALILRPTLIYGDPRLRAVPRLMCLARQTPILPVPGSGRALIQPVFHRDLAVLAAALLEGDAGGGVYAAGGPDTLSMRGFYREVACAAGARCIVSPAPLWSLRLASRAGLRLPLDDTQLARTERDRLAAPQSALDPDIAPKTRLRTGLNELATALGYRPP